MVVGELGTDDFVSLGRMNAIGNARIVADNTLTFRRRTKQINKVRL